MPFYVYFLHSETRKKYYVGISNNVEDRLFRHNSAQSLSTKSGVPWKLAHTIEGPNRSVAMMLETRIKKRGISRYLGDNNFSLGS